MAGELMSMSAVEQAAAVRTGDVSAVELVEASLATIDRRDGEINAVVTRVDERALAEAERVPTGDERPLAGVPVLIKDLTQLTEGVRTTYGSAATGDFVPQFDTSVVRKLREAGAILVGKTSTPELGILPTTEPHRFGPTRNPWDTTRTSGGSSGGASAAVAAGMVALGHGSDGGGSIRIPASCCGLVGLKPSRGRISFAPLVPTPAGLSTDGFLTWTVADTALALDLVSGYELGDPVWVPAPEGTFTDATRREPGRLRIGLTTAAPNGADVHAECVAATQQAAKLLESLGHHVEEAAPPWDAPGIIDMFKDMWIAEVAASIAGLGRLIGHPLAEDELEPLTREMIAAAHGFDAVDALMRLTVLRAYARAAMGWWSDHDVLLTPTLAQPPIVLGSLDPDPGEPALTMLDKAGDFTPFTPPINVTGQPAISLPLHQSADGLPIGVQLVGPPAGEELLLSLAAQLEEAAPWLDRRPAPAAAGA
ncbi:MAG: amidase [Thermoleophilaceae bacterium]|nr:amidase [Thermoleophilaceae bacterium]